MKKERLKRFLKKLWLNILYNFIFGILFFIVYIISAILINGFTYLPTESDIRTGYIIVAIYAFFFFGGNILIYFKKYKEDVSTLKYIGITVLSFLTGMGAFFLFV
jgi:hypothetical protein